MSDVLMSGVGCVTHVVELSQHCVDISAGISAKGSTQPTAHASAVAAPTDPTILRNINTLARYVSKNGPAFEQIARVRNAVDPSFAFLRGGEGAAYYAWKVQQLSSSPHQLHSASAVARRSVPLSADDRGAVLGETALPSAAPNAGLGPALVPPPEPVQYSGFVPSGSQSARPNLTGIAEGDRSRLKNLLASNFQQPSAETQVAQKPILQAGLQHRAASTVPVAAVSAGGGVSAASAQAMVAAMANRFASSGAPQVLGIPQGGLEAATAKPLPTANPPLEQPAPSRTVEEWRPAALLCKRFNIMDPYKGKADRTVQMSRFKTDYLALPDTMAAISHQATSQTHDSEPPPQQQQQQMLPPPPRQVQQQQQQPDQCSLQQQQLHQQIQEQLPGPPPRPSPAGAVSDTVHNMTADAFLSSLGMELAAAGTAGSALPVQEGGAPEEGVQAEGLAGVISHCSRLLLLLCCSSHASDDAILLAYSSCMLHSLYCMLLLLLFACRVAVDTFCRDACLSDKMYACQLCLCDLALCGDKAGMHTSLHRGLHLHRIC